MHTLHPKRPAILALSPLALAMFMLQPTPARAFTPTVNNGAVVDGEMVTGGRAEHWHQRHGQQHFD